MVYIKVVLGLLFTSKEYTLPVLQCLIDNIKHIIEGEIFMFLNVSIQHSQVSQLDLPKVYLQMIVST